jgi:hypothetical protein
MTCLACQGGAIQKSINKFGFSRAYSYLCNQNKTHKIMAETKENIGEEKRSLNFIEQMVEKDPT